MNLEEFELADHEFVDDQKDCKEYKLRFHGDGKTYFGILIVNWLLTLITLGLYYPWAKARNLQYLYGASSLNDNRFTFHGTGKEMFRGFIKAVLILGSIYALVIACVFMKLITIGTLIMYIGMFILSPLAIHGMYRYRMSRTSWRGIRFGYRGDRNEFLKLFFVEVLLTVVTFGIYGSWMAMKIRKYIFGNIRYGDVSFKYSGNGMDFFLLNLKGVFLSIFTLGVYVFWFQRDLYAYLVDNLSMHHGDKEIRFKTNATGGDFFALLIVNILITIFTFGIGYAWVQVRLFEFLLRNAEMEGDIDLDEVRQTEEEFNDATGDELGDFFDLDFDL